MASPLSIPSYMRWLPPEATATLAHLEFQAHGAVDGFISGRHRSHRMGSSTEFAEHRLYAPGDDLRNLDWKLVARRQRYYIKRYVDETNLRATILLDASGSMSYRGDAASEVAGRRVSKLEYAQYLASALTYLLVKQQDAVGLVTFDTKVRDYLPAKAQPSQIRTVLETVDALQAGGETDGAAVFHDIAERIPRRGIVFILSDLFGDPEEIIRAFHHFRFRHHEVIVMHIMAEEELSFPFTSFSRFQCAETAARMNIDPRALRAGYLEKVRAFLKTLSVGCGQMSIGYEPMSTKIPFDQALANCLGRRMLGRG